MKKNLFRLTIIFCICFLAVFSSEIVFSNDSKYTVKIGLPSSPQTINMLEFRIGPDLPVILTMHESLMFTHPETGKYLYTGLAKSWRIINGKDIKMKLHNFAKFHTGDPVTSHDVKFTFEQCANPLNRNLMAGTLADIKEVEVIDDYNLIFRYYEPNAAWRDIMWIGICSKKYYDKVGRDKFRTHPVGSGAYKFVKWERGRGVTEDLVPNHHGNKYGLKWYRAPQAKRLEFIVVTDDIARIAMLETGELDLIGDIAPHHLKRLRGKEHIRIKRTSPGSLYGLSVKPDNFPVMKDINIGLAIRHAINRQEIIDKIFLGYGYPLYMFASKRELGYDPRNKFEFDPERARKLLKQSSYKPGTPLILTYTENMPNYAQVAQAVQKYLTDVGFTIKLQLLERGVQATYSMKKDKREGHMTIYEWNGSRDPSMRLMATLPSKSIYNNWATRKYQKEMDRLCIAQSHEMNMRKRLAILRRIHKLLLEEPQSGTILFGLDMIYAMRDRIDYNWLPGDYFMFYVDRIKIVK
jgi:peptide/nickel transport system substrate-binding protein